MLPSIELCSGPGVGSYASRRHFDIQLALDIWPNAIASYRANHPGLNAVVGDVADRALLDWARKNVACEVLIGSPPCQPFSDGGKGDGEKDKRARVVSDCLLWVEAFRPRAYVFEEVDSIINLCGAPHKLTYVEHSVM